MASRSISPRARAAAACIPLGFSAFCGWSAVPLFQRGDVVPAIGLSVLALFLLVAAVASLSDLSPAERGAPGGAVGEIGIVDMPGSDMVELMRSSDPVQIQAARGLLAANGVAAEIVDLHGSTMLRFLPGASARLLVPRADLEGSVEILRDARDRPGDE